MNEKLLLHQENEFSNNQPLRYFLSFSAKTARLTCLLGILSISTVGFGQTGPVGINNGIDLWLDASDLDADGNVEGASENNLSGSNDVQQWRDKSGQGNHVDAPGSSNDPLYIPTDATFNNKAVVDFDPGEYLFVNCGDWDDTHTVFIVCRQQGTPPANSAIMTFGLGSSSGVDNIAQIGVDTAGTHLAYQTEASGTTFQSLFGTQANALLGPTLLTATRALPNVITTYNNGTLSATLTSATGQSIHRYYLNADKTTTSTNDCQIAEIIVYDRVLTKSEIERIHAYLSCKYATDFGGAAPGGIDPCNVSLWMRANEGVSLTGSDVNTWKDQSRFGFTGTATATEEPLYNAQDNNFNPSLTFNAANSDALSLGTITASDGLMMAANDFNVYSVAFADPTTNGILFADRLCKDANGYHLRFNAVTNKWMFEAGAAGSGSYTSFDSAAVQTLNTTTDFSLVSMTHTGNDYTLRTHQGNSATQATNSDVSYTNTGNQRWIGQEAPCSSTNFNGSLSELIAVRGTVSTTDDRKIRSYLALKYGLSLNSTITNYLASDGTVIWDNTIPGYWFDVAGIGQDDGSLLDQRIAKSQDKSGIVTIASTNNFTAANSDAARTSLGNGNFLIWGNNNVPASNPWTATNAPTGFATLQERWLVSETGTVGTVSIQIDVNDADNDVPTFFGNLYFVRGSSTNFTSVTPTVMTETSPGSGIWRVTGINFNDGDYFTFAVDNRLLVEFTVPSSATLNETSLGSFTNVVHSGVLNIATSYTISGAGTGGAVAGVDFNFSPVTVNVVAGDYSTPVSSAITPAPTLIQDLLIEGNEIVQFSITPTAGCVVGDADASGTIFATHALTITDDDAYNVSINKISDGDEGGPLNATFQIFVVGGSNPTTISGNITWTGNATGGADYDNSVTSFSFPPGTTSQTINLNTSAVIYDDGFLEGTELIIGTISGLTAATGTAVPAVASDTAFISDDEVTGILISIDTVTSMGTTVEGGAALQYVISVDGGVVNNSGSAITGTIAYSGTATPGPSNDFLSVGTFSIPNGVNSTTITINTLPDLFVELTESVIATITVTGGVGGANPSSNSATAFIGDEDAAALTISINVVGGGSGVIEGVDPSVSYNVVMDAGKINGTGGNITGTITMSGTAVNLVDYSVGSTTFVIPNGLSSGVYTVTIVNDGVSEVTDILTATVASTSMGSPSVTNNSVNQNIFDDDSGTLLIGIGSPVGDTESPTGTPTVTFQVSINSGGPAASDITGTLGYTFGQIGEATPDVDFVAAYNYTILAGNSSTTISLPIIDDGLTEPTEAVKINLIGSPSLGNYSSTSSSANIIDDDAGNLTISIDTVSSGYEEGQIAVKFVVSLDFAAVNGTGTSITGNVVYGGNATNGASGDYVPGPNSAATFDIPNGQSTDTLTLFVNDELFIEYTDSVYAIISSPSLGTISQDSALAFIYDNDFDSLSLSIVGSSTNGAEGGGPVEFTISLDNGYINGLGVPLTGTLSFGGTATAGLDYSNFPTFSIPNGSAFVIHSLPVTDDPSLELQEFVIATIAASNPLGAINPNATTDTVYIDDNDLANAQIQITASDGVEMPNPFHPVFIVGFVGGLTNETGVPITGQITLTGNATEGTDYVGVFTYTIENDSVQDVIPMVLIDDLLVEPDELISATISAPSQGTLGPNITAVAKILDDDTDVDNDGLSDLVDPIVGNIDSDCDGIFDGCDVDADGDGLPDDGGIDLNGDGTNDVFYNLYSFDNDLDGIKDTCDADADGNGTIENGPDQNNDELNDNMWSNLDNDLDLLPDHVDPNDNNIDSDGDGITDGADADVNGDGILDNGCDDDGDGIHNTADADNNPGKPDLDGDGIVAEWDMQDLILNGASINYIVSPNNDGVNDVLEIPGIQVEDQHELIIFNRFGEVVYTTTEYDNEWFGQINTGIVVGSDVLPDGVYFYTLDFRNGNEVVRGYIEIRH